MSTEAKYRDPTNRIVCVFNTREDAEGARGALRRAGFDDQEIFVLQGQQDALRLDTSPKWFADTDEEIERYEQALNAGSTVLSIPVADAETREQVHTIVNQHNAELITHFGLWVTETMS